jgi:hypothetical protein
MLTCASSGPASQWHFNIRPAGLLLSGVSGRPLRLLLAVSLCPASREVCYDEKVLD